MRSPDGQAIARNPGAIVSAGEERSAKARGIDAVRRASRAERAVIASYAVSIETTGAVITKKRLVTVGRQALLTSCGSTTTRSGRPDSNRRRPAWEAGILPTEYARRAGSHRRAEYTPRGRGLQDDQCP